jgi:hypothetical protein
LVWGVNQLVDAGGIWEEGEGEESENFTLCVHALLYGVVVVGVGGVVEGAAEACCSHFCALGDEACRIECRGLCVITSLAWTLLKTEVGKRWLLREGSNICEWWCTAVRPVTMTFGKLGPGLDPGFLACRERVHSDCSNTHLPPLRVTVSGCSSFFLLLIC